MTEKYLNINLDDAKTDIIAEALSNKTCRKILSLLAEKEMNLSEIADELKIPLNTAGYNIEKLVSAGLIEKSSKVFWSSKGKRINSYHVADKKIVISPKNIFRGIVPAVVVTALIALGIKVFVETNSAVKSVSADYASNGLRESASLAAPVIIEKAGSALPIVQDSLNNAGYSWLWFILGALISLIIVLAWNWRKF